MLWRAVTQLTLDGRDRSGWSCRRWRHGSDSRPTCLCWSAGREWAESDLQSQTGLISSWQDLTLMLMPSLRVFHEDQPPSSNNHQTSMVPLPCFFLNCWLLSSRRWSVGLRGDLESVNNITLHHIRTNKLCNVFSLVSDGGALGFTSDVKQAALVAGGFRRTGLRVGVLC